MSSGFAAPICPLLPHHFINLILILRRANAHYRSIAADIRASLRPSDRARGRARFLGLRVDIRKAVQCDQKQISIVPLPILDTSCSPAEAMVPRIYLGGDLQKAGSSLPLKRQPALRCVIPEVVTRTTPNGTTSAIALSALTSTYSEKRVSSYDASMWSTDGEDAWFDVPIDYSVGPSILWRPLDVPIDEEEMDWSLDDISDMDISSSDSSDSGSDTTSTTDFSTGPTTPVDEEPVMLRIKRKSFEVSDDGFEKRPRFERREWVPSTFQRRNVIRIPARG